MKKFGILTLLFGLTMALTACPDEDNDGGNIGYAPGSCFGQYDRGYDPYYDQGFNQGFDRRFGGDRCGFGPERGFYQGQPRAGWNPCERWEDPYMWASGRELRPIFYPGQGGFICAEYRNFVNHATWGTPQLYNGIPGWYQGCIPGGNSCGGTCNNWGGTIGIRLEVGIWAGYGGQNAGFCY